MKERGINKRGMRGRLLALLLAAAMLMALAACSGDADTASTEGGTSGETASDGGYTTLTLLLMRGTQQDFGLGSWVDKYIKDNVGIAFDALLTADQADTVMTTALASGKLPDLIYFSDTEHLQNAIAGGMVLELSQYEEQLPNVFGYDLLDSALRYIEESYGGLYILPMSVGESSVSMNYNMQMLWNAYEDAGYPAIETEEQFLDVLEDMWQYWQETPDGLSTYPLGLFASWDSVNMANVGSWYVQNHGWTMEDLSCALYAIPYDGSGSPVSILEDDSIYYQGLKWLFEANQRGLIDPESTTQTWDEYNAKGKASRYLAMPWSWYGSAGEKNIEDYYGYTSVWPDYVQVKIDPATPLGDTYLGRGWAISSACEDVDKALEFLNFYYEHETQMVLANGPVGELWDYAEDGSAYYTDTYYDWTDVQDESLNDYVVQDGGGTLYNGTQIFNDRAYAGVNPETGNLYGLGNDPDAQTQETEYSIMGQAVVDYYSEKFGTEYESMYWYQKENETGQTIQPTVIFSFLEAMDSDMDEIATAIGYIVQPASWQMVFAADEAEFEEIWDAAQADAETLGLAELTTYMEERWDRAVDKAAEYGY